MKKSRDDVLTVPPQHEGPGVSSSAEPSGRAQKSTASSAQRLTTNDALSYLKAVKENFEDKKDKYNDFLDVMKDFKAQRMDTSGVILKVKELFKGNRDLILGFNTFLPKGYEITLPPEDEPLFKKKPVDFEEAISFVNKIKTRFQGDDHVYKAFLDILNMYRKDNKSITDVYREVSVLFQDHADLLGEFKHFLPNTTGAASIDIAPSGKNNVLRQNDRGTPMAMARTNHVEKKPAVSYAVRDQNVDHPDSERLNPVGKEYEKREDRDKSEWENDDDDSLDHKRKYACRDDSLTEQFHQGRLRPVLTFCDKVKERLQNTKDYKKFLDCVRSYGSKFLTTPQFQKLVTDLLGRHPDLMEECGNFINYVEKNGCFPNNKQQSRSLKVEDRNGDNPDAEDRDGKDDNNKERDRYERGLAFDARDVPGQKQSAVREKYLAKPVQELDLSNCESCTPSYRLLPDDYPIPKASWRTKIGAEVLNDCWVSVTSGSEDYSFKNMRKNQYEESLFRCEDDRFELDMLLESVNATAKRVEELLDSMDADTCKTDNPFHVNDHLTALDLRCIERLYGDHGLDVMDVLKKNALLALPIILTRLKQKQEEWARCRLDFGKVWAEIYAKNYHKSLDHRSFYFKQQDTKNLSPKAMISEIKEMSENNQNEDEMILSIGAGYRQPIKPHMEFEYPDCDIHEDIYQLMKYSCGEMCTPEQHDKIMKIWTTFLEQVLGVPWRPPNSEDIENIVKTNNHVTEIVYNIGEKNGNHIGEAASENCKSSDTSKNEKICSSRVLLANGNDGVNDDGSPDSDNIASGGAHTGLMQTDAYMSSAVPGASKETGFSDQGADGVNVDCQLKVISHEESHSQDGVSGKHSSSSTGMVYEEIKTQNCHEEKEGRSTSEREEGELSPNQNVGENNFAEYGNYGTKPAHDHRKESPSARTRGEEMCIQEAGINTVANGDDEAVESAHCSSDSENASENGDVSGSESADGEECSPEEPDEDAGQEENNNKTGEEGEAELHESDGVISSSDCSLLNLKPLTMETHPSLRGKEKNSEIFYGSDSFYLLFRLHQMLYERMQSAKLHSSSPESKWRIPNGSNPEDSYARFKDALYNLLNGSSDNAKFEDDCRAIIGAQSYILFTLDKLIHRLVKQLQTIAGEEIDSKLLQLYVYERSRNPGKFADAVYHENARFLLPEDNLYRVECLPSSMRLTIQLMKTEHDKPEPTAVSMDPTFAAYLNNELLSVVPERKEKEKPRIFVKRNKRKVLTKYGVSDACNAMDGLITYNGLEIKVASSTFKAAYVLDTEDFLYRRGKRRKTLGDNGLCHGASKRFSRLMVS